MSDSQPQILEWLAGGDLRSDGMADEVADTVLENLDLLDDLLAGLQVGDDVIRGRTAHAIERISRSRPDVFVGHLPELMRIAVEDSLAMVRWHLAMLMANQAMYHGQIEAMAATLLKLLADDSVIVRSWTISSLSIVGRLYPEWRSEFLRQIAPLQQDKSIAIRTRAGKAVQVLKNDAQPFPTGWIKSKHLELPDE